VLVPGRDLCGEIVVAALGMGTVAAVAAESSPPLWSSSSVSR